MADPTPVAPAPVSTLTPGWKTTELYVAMLALGGLGYSLEELVRVLPTIAANPALASSPWIAPLLSLAPIGIGFVMKLVASEYGQLRKELKLGDQAVQTAQAAGAAAAAQTPDATLAALNK